MDLFLKTMNIDIRLNQFAHDLEKTTIEGSVDYELNQNIHIFRTEAAVRAGSQEGARGQGLREDGDRHNQEEGPLRTNRGPHPPRQAGHQPRNARRRNGLAVPGIQQEQASSAG